MRNICFPVLQFVKMMNVSKLWSTTCSRATKQVCKAGSRSELQNSSITQCKVLLLNAARSSMPALSGRVLPEDLQRYALFDDERDRARTKGERERKSLWSKDYAIRSGNARSRPCPESSTLVIGGSRREHWWETYGGE